MIVIRSSIKTCPYDGILADSLTQIEAVSYTRLDSNAGEKDYKTNALMQRLTEIPLF